MVYTKNHNPWTSAYALTNAIMDNFETQYTEAYNLYLIHNHDSSYYTKGVMLAKYWNASNDGAGSGADADLIYKLSGNLHGSSFQGLGVPSGLAVLWYGSTASIPDGWHLCDGNAGTVDLRNKFIVGAGATFPVGNQGGSTTFRAYGTITITSHQVTIAEMGPHRHPFVDTTPVTGTYYEPEPIGAGPLTPLSGTTPAAGGGAGHSHGTAEGTNFAGNDIAAMPYYYALCFIQKL